MRFRSLRRRSGSPRSTSPGRTAPTGWLPAPHLARGVRADLIVENLRVSYGRQRGEDAVLDGVSFEATHGQIHAVIGESGAGKTTLLRALAGALPLGAQCRGRLVLRTVEGEETSLLADGQGRPTGAASAGSLLPPTPPLAGRVIGVVPQSAATALTPVRTVGAQLAETCAALESRWEPGDLLERAGLPASTKHLYPLELSGGMAQRAALACALAGSPAVLLADEPTSALDPHLTRSLLGVLRELADEGMAIVLITHDIEELEESDVADRVSVLHRGHIGESGPTGQVLTSPSHPHTRTLLAALPTRGLRAPDWEAAPYSMEVS